MPPKGNTATAEAIRKAVTTSPQRHKRLKDSTPADVAPTEDVSGDRVKQRQRLLEEQRAEEERRRLEELHAAEDEERRRQRRLSLEALRKNQRVRARLFTPEMLPSKNFRTPVRRFCRQNDAKTCREGVR